MTLVYHFTTGVNATGNSGPFDTGRAGVEQFAPPTTRQGMFDAIREALAGPTGAGWTETVASTGNRRIYTSPGESGNEDITLVLNQGDPASPNVRFILFGCAPSTNPGGEPQNVVNDGNTTNRIDFSTSDFTMEFQILASLDFIWVFISRQSNETSYALFAGLLRREGYNSNVLSVGPAGASAGTNVLVPTTVNPATLGIRLGDTLTLMDQGPSVPPVAENVLVTGVEGAGVRVLELTHSYTAGSRLGDSPNPLVCAHWNGNQSIDGAGSTVANSSFLSCYRFSGPGDMELMPAGSDGRFDVNYVNFKILGPLRTIGTTQQGFGVSAVPETRTNRFVCPEMALLKGTNRDRIDVGTNPGKAMLGVLPGIALYPGIANFFPHDNMLRTRNVASPQDWVPVRFSGSSTGSDEHYVLGPTPL